MSLRYRTKHATATLAFAACVLAVSGVSAVELNDSQGGATAPAGLFQPASAPCHPALGACAKHAQSVATGNSTTVAYEQSAQTDGDPVSLLCHPARKACANWTQASRTSAIAR
jgi:hypothetical protein